ncbi:MAG: type I-E CRISPR-associated protein Cas5/CasD [Hyphomicrobium sp.]|nr:type I-E CRISPR-associated protein Cas5/CasD [Hyphomicrobium sp.]
MPSISENTPQQFLVFRLWGPMTSWGDIAVGERRGTWSRPSRSAILGLVASALGIERSNGSAHDRLEAGLGFAVRIDHPGRPMRDYHTAQSPGARKGLRWHTRRDELDPSNDLNTILSERSYMTEMDASIVLWQRPDTVAIDVAGIAERLSKPVFGPFLGRKSCPLGLPLRPYLLDAPSPLAALLAHDARPVEERMILTGLNRPRRETRELWMDEDDARTFGLESLVRERTTRRDRIRDRPRWLFSDRNEVLIDTGRTP